MASSRKSNAKGDSPKQLEQGGACSLPNCSEPATGQGSHWDGPLCAAHLKRDKDRFRESYYTYRQSTLDGAMRRVADHMDLTRGALFELTSDRANASDMFEEILEIVTHCRDIVIGRLDAKIDEMESNLKSLHFFEKLRTDINESETAGDLVNSFQLSKKMQLALDDAPIPETWTDPVDNSVELVQKLLQVTKTLAGIAEDTDGTALRTSLESSTPDVKVQLLNYIQFVFHCTNTDGFYCSLKSVSKTQQNGYQPLPSPCILAVGHHKANMFFAFYSTELVVLSQWNMPSNGVTVVSGSLVNHLQQMFLLGNNKSLIVCDLAGSQLKTVDNIDFEVDKPIMSHDMEKLYIFNAGAVNCLSLELCDLLETTKLPDDAKDVRSLTVSGRSLILCTSSAVYRLSLSTKRIVKLWLSNAPNLLCVANIGSGFVAVCDSIGSVAVISSNRQIVKVIDLVRLGVNYFKACASCGVSYTFQSISCTGSSRDFSCSFLLLFSLSCGHRVLSRITIY